MKAMIDAEEGIDYVDGTIVEINGIRIGGASGWYDGSLLLNGPQWNYEKVQALWEKHMSDSNTIYPTAKEGSKFDDLFHEQKHRLDAVYKECAIMMTHISPLSEWEQFKAMYNYQPALDQIDPKYSVNHEALKEYRAFYCFDGKEYLENGSMSHWIFGHTHQIFKRSYERSDGKKIDILCNPMELKKPENIHSFMLKTFEI
jgi:ASC-1-like (ASCH) protein